MSQANCPICGERVDGCTCGYCNHRVPPYMTTSVTKHYQLPLWSDGDVTSWLIQMNNAMERIDHIMHIIAIHSGKKYIDEQLKIMREEWESLHNRVDDLATNAIAMSNIIESLAGSVKKIMADISKLTSDQSNLADKVNTLEANVVSILEDIVNINKTLESINFQLDQQSNMIASIQQTLYNQHQEIVDIKADITDIKTDVAENTKNIAQLMQDIADLTHSLEGTDGQISDISRQLGILTANDVKQDTTLQNYGERITALETSGIPSESDPRVDTLVQQMLVVQQKNSQQDTEISELQNNLSQAQNDIIEADSRLNTIEQKDEGFENRISNLEKGGSGGLSEHVIYDKPIGDSSNMSTAGGTTVTVPIDDLKNATVIIEYGIGVGTEYRTSCFIKTGYFNINEDRRQIYVIERLDNVRGYTYRQVSLKKVSNGIEIYFYNCYYTGGTGYEEFNSDCVIEKITLLY